MRDCKGGAPLLEGNCVEITIERVKEKKGEENGKENESMDVNNLFPSKIELRLKEADLQGYMANISNYSFLATMVIILSFFTMLGVIKQVTENHALA